jgi:RNA polymerase sigma-70 factor, ECF subfamily
MIGNAFLAALQCGNRCGNLAAMISSEPDVDLMLRVRNGDNEAFRQLVERHQRAVINLIYRSIGDSWEAEDLAQRVFVQVFRSAGRYQPTAKFTTWLFTIVHNTILNEYRRRGRHATQSLEAMTQPDDPEGEARQLPDARAVDPHQAVAEQELRERIQAAIKLLPENQRTAVLLCRFEGLSYEEIAKVLHCSVAAVKSLLHRARETLKEQLRGYY